MRFILAFLLLTSVLQAFSNERVAEAIRLVENSRTRGASGELGEWQMLPSVWRQHSTKSFWSSTDEERREVAIKHVVWIRQRLHRLGLPETVESVALVWNAGYGTVKQGRTKDRHFDYARRASNLYRTLP